MDLLKKTASGFISSGKGKASSSDGPKLKVLGEEILEDGEQELIEISNATLTVSIKKSHERFLPSFIDRKLTMQGEQLEVVQCSWRDLLSGASSTFKAHLNEDCNSNRVVTPVTFFYDLFWEKLFSVAPSMRDIFRDNMVRQSRCLVRMACECAGLYDAVTRGDGLSGLEALARANFELGIRAEHYEPIGMSFKHALAYCSGSAAWTSNVALAWDNVISIFVLVAVSVTVSAAEEAEVDGESEADQYTALLEYRAAVQPAAVPSMPALSPFGENFPEDDAAIGTAGTGSSRSTAALSPESDQAAGEDTADKRDETRTANAASSAGADGAAAGAAAARKQSKSWLSSRSNTALSDAESTGGDSGGFNAGSAAPLTGEDLATLAGWRTERGATNAEFGSSSNSSGISTLLRHASSSGGSSMRQAIKRALNSRRGSLSRSGDISSAIGSATASSSSGKGAAAGATTSADSELISRHLLNAGVLVPSAADTAPISAMGPAAVLALIERTTPEGLCRCAGAVAGALLRCLAPQAAVRDRGMTLHSCVGWVWKLLAVDRSDRKSLKLRRAALKAHLPKLVPAVLECLDGASTLKTGGVSLRSARALQIEALDAVAQMARFLQVRFQDYIDTTQRAASPLLASGGGGVRAAAASAVAVLPLCGKDPDGWAHAASRVCVEAHAMVQQAWPDDSVDMGGVKLNMAKVEELLKGHALLPALSQEEYANMERHAQALARRLPALTSILCKLLTSGGRAAAADLAAADKAAALAGALSASNSGESAAAARARAAAGGDGSSSSALSFGLGGGSSSGRSSGQYQHNGRSSSATTARSGSSFGSVSGAPSLQFDSTAAATAAAMAAASSMTAAEASAASARRKSIRVHYLLVLALLDRILRMGADAESACAAASAAAQIHSNSSSSAGIGSSSSSSNKLSSGDSAGSEAGAAAATAAAVAALQPAVLGALSPSGVVAVLPTLQRAAVELLETLLSTPGLAPPRGLHERACRCITRSLAALPVHGGQRGAALRALQAGLKDASAHPAGAMYLATTVPAALIDEVALLVGRTLTPGQHYRAPARSDSSSASASGHKQQWSGSGSNNSSLSDSSSSHSSSTLATAVPPFFSGGASVPNAGHGESLSLPTAACGASALSAFLLELNSLLPALDRRALEAVLCEGLALLLRYPLGTRRAPPPTTSAATSSGASRAAASSTVGAAAGGNSSNGSSSSTTAAASSWDAAVPGEAPVVTHAAAREAFLSLLVTYLKVQWAGTGARLRELALAVLEVCGKESDPAVSRLAREALKDLDDVVSIEHREARVLKRRSSTNKAAAVLGLNTHEGAAAAVLSPVPHLSATSVNSSTSSFMDADSSNDMHSAHSSSMSTRSFSSRSTHKQAQQQQPLRGFAYSSGAYGDAHSNAVDSDDEGLGPPQRSQQQQQLQAAGLREQEGTAAYLTEHAQDSLASTAISRVNSSYDFFQDRREAGSKDSSSTCGLSNSGHKQHAESFDV